MSRSSINVKFFASSSVLNTVVMFFIQLRKTLHTKFEVFPLTKSGTVLPTKESEAVNTKTGEHFRHVFPSKLYKILTLTKTASVFVHYHPSFWDLERTVNDSHVAPTPEVRMS